VSRGILTSSFLKQQSQQDPSTVSRYVDYVKSLEGNDAPLDVAGFNLILFEPRNSPTSTPIAPEGQPSGHVTVSYEATLVTNSGGGGPITSRPIGRSLSTAATKVDGGGGDDGEGEGGGDTESQCGVISNAIDGRTVDGLGSSVPWTKVLKGRQLFSEVQTIHRLRHSMTMKHNGTSPSSLHGTDDSNDADERLVEDLFALLGCVVHLHCLCCTSVACSLSLNEINVT
jgi:hypothetical protein